MSRNIQVIGVLVLMSGSDRILTTFAALTVECPVSPPCKCDGNSIDCSSLNLTEIPRFSKAANPWFQVDLSNNKITRVRSRAFENITINLLQISHNQINTFADDALVGSENILEFLFMQYNNMTELPSAIGKMKKMSSLSIHHNPVQIFDEEIFKNVSSCLTFLAFGSSEMKTWPTSIKALKRLDSLDVYAVSFESLPDDIFDGLEDSLHLFDVDSTSLIKVPETLNRLKNLEVIGFFNNSRLRLEGIPQDAFKGLNSVDMVSIMNSTFNTLPNITQLINLRQIDVSYTPIAFWSADNLPTQPIITQIQLSGTQLQRVPEALSQIKSLQHLEISASQITHISATDFKGLQKLEIINFWQSPITNISDQAFSDNYLLTSLMLDNTNLTAIPKAITNLPSLHYLSLDGNRIQCTCASMGWLRKWIGFPTFDVEGSCDNLHGMWISDYFRKELPKCPKYE